ncbi:alpha-N-arabinofuranosidase [Pedobacter sp. MW01-1-1]|uniref:alpha-N-arabinofuranosidase n=1 Tax=Pedobacter sp. MW01-1-1 TaxID=3383027 RepID=UPI003FEF8AD2
MKKLFLFIVPLCLSLNSRAQNDIQVSLQPAGNQIISKHIYGHFSEHLGRCIYDGFWVDENSTIPNKGRIRLDVVDALKKINIPNLRWPGGCFADEYHWRDGIGPRNARPKMVNTNWGGVVEDNSFGTNEFLDLCEMLQCEPYIAGNVGSGTVEEMAKWVEYLNFDGESPMTKIRKENGREKPWKVTYWGVGNESWGCGGNMTPAYYSDLYRRYATYARNYEGAPLKKIASGANAGDYNWTETLMKNVGRQMWGLTLHYYTIPTGKWTGKGSATKFDEQQYFTTMQNCLKMEELVTKHSAIMDKYDAAKKVALVVDEWGIWTDVEPGTNPGFLYQQNSLRDALIAGTTLNIFNNHSDRVKMANLAQTVNVLQALILTEKDKMLLTPTYHVFDLYKVHQDAKYLPISFTSPDYAFGDKKIPALNISASQDSTGAVHLSLVNLDPKNKLNIRTALAGIKWKSVSGKILTSAKLTDVNTFNEPNKVHISNFTAAKKKGDALQIELPAQSVVVLELK